MSARVRAEAGLMLCYTLAVPFVVVLAAVAQLFMMDLTWAWGVPHGLRLLNGTLPSALAGAFLLMMLRLAAEHYMAAASLARWPVRLAPVLLSAGALTAVAWRVLAGQGALGLIVMPAVALWGAAAGEWLAHRWIAHGRDTGTLIRRFVLAAGTTIAWLVIASWFLHSPA